MLASYEFDHLRGSTRIVKEPIGVVRLHHPVELADEPDHLQGRTRRWPVGCTMVLKPSEIAPFSAYLFAQILDEAGVPPGVFNLVNGDGPTVGARQSRRTPTSKWCRSPAPPAPGIEVARNAAPTVKRVHQELGGKSPNLVLDDADMATAIPENRCRT